MRPAGTIPRSTRDASATCETGSEEGMNPTSPRFADPSEIPLINDAPLIAVGVAGPSSCTKPSRHELWAQNTRAVFASRSHALTCPRRSGSVSIKPVGYIYDERAWPVVQFRFSGRLTADESKQYFRGAEREPFADAVVDVIVAGSARGVAT